VVASASQRWETMRLIVTVSTAHVAARKFMHG
jgi:hypothetical protein